MADALTWKERRDGEEVPVTVVVIPEDVYWTLLEALDGYRSEREAKNLHQEQGLHKQAKRHQSAAETHMGHMRDAVERMADAVLIARPPSTEQESAEDV